MLAAMRQGHSIFCSSLLVRFEIDTTYNYIYFWTNLRQPSNVEKLIVFLYKLYCIVTAIGVNWNMHSDRTVGFM